MNPMNSFVLIWTVLLEHFVEQGRGDTGGLRVFIEEGLCAGCPERWGWTTNKTHHRSHLVEEMESVKL